MCWFDVLGMICEVFVLGTTPWFGMLEVIITEYQLFGIKVHDIVTQSVVWSSSPQRGQLIHFSMEAMSMIWLFAGKREEDPRSGATLH